MISGVSVRTAFGPYPLACVRRFFRDDEWRLALSGSRDMDEILYPRSRHGLAAQRLENVATYFAEIDWLAGRPLGHRPRIRVPARSRRVA